MRLSGRQSRPKPIVTGGRMTTSPIPSYCEIPLTKGQVAKVSPRWYEELSKFNWSASFDKKNKVCYAVRRDSTQGKNYRVKMHRVILGLCKGDGIQVDHEDHDGLNNVDENIRIATGRQQACNRRTRSDNALGLKGVCKLKSGKFQANASIDGKWTYLGVYDTAQEAHDVYCEAVLKNHGKFACLK